MKEIRGDIVVFLLLKEGFDAVRRVGIVHVFAKFECI
jgi:hypothetical protein